MYESEQSPFERAVELFFAMLVYGVCVFLFLVVLYAIAFSATYVYYNPPWEAAQNGQLCPPQ